MTKKSLKVTLHDDDILFFLHIPKTAGLSLITILDSNFEPDEIFPLHSAPSPEMFKAYAPEQMTRFRLVRGHFEFGPYDNGVYKYLAQNPICITMLREPIARTISHYRHNRRHAHARWHDVVVSQNMSLKDFVCSPDTYDAVVNCQTRLIAGQIKGSPTGYHDSEALSDEAFLFIAKERLEQFSFFGLTERFQESVLMLSYIFGWEPPAEEPWLNRSPESGKPESISSETLELIKDRTRLDAELYSHAEQLFQERLNQMLKELVKENYQRQADLERLDVIENSPAWHLIQRVTKLRKKIIPPRSIRENAYRYLHKKVFRS